MQKVHSLYCRSCACGAFQVQCTLYVLKKVDLVKSALEKVHFIKCKLDKFKLQEIGDSYDPDNVFNMNGTELYYRDMPNKILCVSGDFKPPTLKKNEGQIDCDVICKHDWNF